MPYGRGGGIVIGQDCYIIISLWTPYDLECGCAKGPVVNRGLHHLNKAVEQGHYQQGLY